MVYLPDVAEKLVQCTRWSIFHAERWSPSLYFVASPFTLEDLSWAQIMTTQFEFLAATAVGRTPSLSDIALGSMI
jgi:hypothetical protein